MSDSDDTDILLLIPPDFFISSAEEKLRKENDHQQQQQQQEHHKQQTRRKLCRQQHSKEFLNESISNALRNYSYDDDWDPTIHHPMDKLNNEVHSVEAAGASNAHLMPPPTAAYQFLPSRKKVELNHINARLASFEDEPFSAPSDISTISNCTVRTQSGNVYRPQRDALGLIHSTPKCPPLKEKGGVSDRVDDGVLHEIDNFLEDNNRNYGAQWNPSKHHSDDFRFCQQEDPPLTQDHHASSLPNALNRLSLDKKYSKCEERSQSHYPVEQDNLISLSEIWGKSGQQNTIAAAPSLTLKEEQLRRQHLERTVHSLQSRLLEYQQRLSVAIEVDRSKDAALANAQAENKSLTQEVRQLRDSVFKLESEHREYKSSHDLVQKELAQAVNLATKFQEKNDKLEQELANSSRKSNECTSLYKKQVEELELKVHSVQRSEELALNELNKLKDKLAKSEYQGDKFKTRCDELEKESLTLRHQKELLQEYHQKQKNRADALETQKKSMHDLIENLTQNETTLKKKLESQQKSLKSHYQQQLENVVAQKLKEFQEQLDKTEESLRTEARDRERLIADRAVKQLELINEKNELELNLMQEKHNEEVELYRIQLANASKKIDDLELKLNAYKSKRADIAEKLHNVMEAQWQKALEILTSPNQSRQTDTQLHVDSPESNEKQNNENGYHDTPKTSKKINNINAEHQQQPPVDKLQAYIELLLSKSPAAFDKLDEILALSKCKSNAGKLDKGAKRTNNCKPPWKA